MIIHEGPLEKDQETQIDHVPVVFSLVLHNVQGPGHVAVTVVAKEVVHPMPVDPIRLTDGLVPTVGAAREIPDVHFQIAGRPAKGHDGDGSRSVRSDRVGPPKIVGPAVAVGDSQMPDERQECRDGM